MPRKIFTPLGPARNIMPTGMAFVLEHPRKTRKKLSARCKQKRHTECSGKGKYTHLRSEFYECECPCHKQSLDPKL